MRTLAALAVASLVGLVLLLGHDPNITFAGGDVEIECTSVWAASSGDGPTVTARGVAATARVVRGADELVALEEEAAATSEGDGTGTIRQQVEARCVDRRAQLLLGSQLALLGFVGGGGAAVGLAVQSYRRRPSAYVPPNVSA